MNFVDLGLRPELVRAVGAAGYTDPTPIQERAIPSAIEGRDLIACAQTGTGKTAAFLLPILHRLATGTQTRSPRALIVAPTRELAAQSGEMAKQYGKYLPLRSAVLFGGVGMGPQTNRLQRGIDLLIATPGRLLDHMRQKHVSLGTIQIVVLDEADRMLDMGFLPDVRRILSALPSTRQNLFFSATMPPEVEQLIRRTTKDPVLVEVSRRATPVDAIRQVVHPVAMASKKDALGILLKRDGIGQTLVFTRTKARANQLVRYLEASRRRTAAIHGNKSQSARNRALASFRSGEIDTLIATDIAARGLDVDGISHVVNFDLPHVPEDYVHRIGRTARAGKSGDAISLFAPEERGLLAAIERLVGKKIPSERIDVPAISERAGVRPVRPTRPDRRGRQEPNSPGWRTKKALGEGSGPHAQGRRRRPPQRARSF